MSALVDTGANISLIHAGIFSRIPCEDRPRLEHEGLYMILADGKGVPVQGMVEMYIDIGGKKRRHEFWVADLGPDCILGLDFLRQHDCVIYARRGQVVIEGGVDDTPRVSTAVTKPLVDELSCRVVVSETTILPGQSEVIVSGKVKDMQGTDTGGTNMMNPSSSLFGKKGILAARCVVDVRQGDIPVRLVNLSDKDVTVYRGTTVGVCEGVEEVSSGNGADDVTEGPHKGVGLLPAHLEKLFGDCTELLDDTQKGEVMKFMHRWQGAFAKGAGDLGRTSIDKHRINTGDHPPIRQPARRLPMNKQEEATKEIKDILSHDIIEPSRSPWSSPIVLVKKKDGSMRFCVDYRKVNDVTVKDSYPLPRIDDTLDKLSDAAWFSTLDLASGYWQIEMEPQDRDKTAFATHEGLFQFDAVWAL